MHPKRLGTTGVCNNYDYHGTAVQLHCWLHNHVAWGNLAVAQKRRIKGNFDKILAKIIQSWRYVPLIAFPLTNRYSQKHWPFKAGVALKMMSIFLRFLHTNEKACISGFLIKIMRFSFHFMLNVTMVCPSLMNISLKLFLNRFLQLMFPCDEVSKILKISIKCSRMRNLPNVQLSLDFHQHLLL